MSGKIPKCHYFYNKQYYIFIVFYLYYKNVQFLLLFSVTKTIEKAYYLQYAINKLVLFIYENQTVAVRRNGDNKMKWKKIAYYIFFCLCIAGVGFGWNYFEELKIHNYSGIYSFYENLLFLLLGIVFILPQLVHYFTNHLRMKINWILFVLNILILLFGCISWSLPIPNWIISMSPIIIFATMAYLPNCWSETRNKKYYRSIW